ncbi:hypothetical protein [Peribacillus phoenicis]|uniref:hypothetical protein n=1 Tax=unclassified Peribacillus TaxID=2675266 RepID=UPI00399F6C8D
MQKKEKKNMAALIQEDVETLDFMDEIKSIISETVNKNNLSKEEIEKALDYKRR